MENNSESSASLERTLRALLLVGLCSMKQRQQIALLDKAGFRQSEIAEVVGSTPKAVSVRLAEMRRVAREKSNTK